MDLIMNDVPEQSLSLASQLSNSIKQQIVDSLLEGSIEFHKQSGQNYNQYALMRKFAIILLRDITKGNDSFVRSQFQPFLNERIESIIIEKFNTKTERIDDDINISADQVDNLTSAIAKGLTYPELNEHGNIDYNDLMNFLEKLCKIFKWDIYKK